MKVLFATTNPAKIKSYKEELEKREIEVLTLKDLQIDTTVEETGKNAIENAVLKAKGYYEIANIPTISMDVSLFIEDFSEEEQPSVNIRRVKGKVLNDEEAISYYANLVKQHGGKVKAKWVYGVAIYDGIEVKTYTYSKGNFYFVDTPSKKIKEGYPLDSITIMPEYNKYLTELTEQEKAEQKQINHKEEVFDFIVKNIIDKI